MSFLLVYLRPRRTPFILLYLRPLVPFLVLLVLLVLLFSMRLLLLLLLIRFLHLLRLLLFPMRTPAVMRTIAAAAALAQGAQLQPALHLALSYLEVPVLVDFIVLGRT